MDNKELLRQEIAAAWTDRGFLKETGFGKKDAVEKLVGRNRKRLQDELFALSYENPRFRTDEVEQIAVRHIALLRKAPEEGWCRHAFLYVRGILFPDMESEISDIETYRLGRSVFLQLLRGLFRYEQQVLPFDPTYDIQLLDEKDPEMADCTPEYARIKRLASGNYLYEFMRLGVDLTGFQTLGHMFGVHYIAMLMAKQLKKAGVPVDLGLISGASAGHDIGKYGCRKDEARRVPYLHYYYTDRCYHRFDLPDMAHIAANHSTWDLELEDLSVESLLLIYADFRVKSTVETIDEKRVETIRFYSLQESYAVILSKLDNVDEAKKHRYEKVYAKLRDFEYFMISRGARTEIPEDFSSYDGSLAEREEQDAVFLKDHEMLEQLKFRAIDHNIRIMADIHVESGFSSVIEAARSELQWKNQRTYLTILAEYSKYLPERQKLLTAAFFYDQLSNRESDIRGFAARALARLIATFREEYKKELPQGIIMSDVNVTNVSLFSDYLEKMFFSGPKLTEKHRNWIMGCINVFVPEVLANCRKSCRHRYVDVLETYYRRRDLNAEQMLYLSKTLMDLDRSLTTASFEDAAAEYLAFTAKHRARSLRVAAVLARRSFFPEQSTDFYETELRAVQKEKYGEIGFDSMLNLMFLDDLKISTPWIDKIANIQMMMHYAMDDNTEELADHGRLLHIATHYCNIIKISDAVVARLFAGKSLVSLVEKLPPEQRTEVAIELFNGLEIGDVQFSRYIPDYLGRILLYLPPKELDEFIEDLRRLMEKGSGKTAVAVINTLFITFANYASYAGRFSEKEGVGRKRRFYLLGLLMKAYSGYDRQLSQEAFWLIGNGIFDSSVLSLEEKAEICSHCTKKLLMIFDEKHEKELDFFNNAASLNQIYRFLSEYETEIGRLSFRHPKKVAFFPGTFDPFSLGHKAVARAIRDAGFEVYLALDEFSWSKKTQPHLERRKIMLMSIADEEHIYLFSDDVPVNIANPADLRRLKEIFSEREVYIAVGTDVIKHASCYKAAPQPDSIHSMNHITFARESSSAAGKERHGAQMKEQFPITGKVVRLSIKKYYEDISSTRIRENINQNRDISTLISSFAQNYIYKKNLYLREPTYKHVLQARELSISPCGPVPKGVADALADRIRARKYDSDRVRQYLFRDDVEAIFIESGTKVRKVIGLACVHCIDTDRFYEEFRDIEIASHIRKEAGGRAAVIGFFLSLNTPSITNISQILLTEILTELLARDYTYVVYNPVDPAGEQDGIIEAFRRQGFVRIPESTERPLFAVHMQAPNIMFRDVEEGIKSPFNKNPRVRHAIDNAHNRLLHTLTQLYPGQLTLSFNSSAVYNKIIGKVAELNGVSTVPDPNSEKGPYMSVPFGKALSNVVVPNTVTKSVHIEKYFSQDIRGFRIGETHGYTSLDKQAAMLHSFNRPIILIEDLLHKGYRMNKIMPALQKNHVEVKCVVAGVLTGKARDRMTELGRAVESAYFIPSINVWLSERDCYPFIGGDGIDDDSFEMSDRHINLIMPYAFPGFIDRSNVKAIYQYSMTCLENAAEIMKTLEEEYQKLFEKKLTLKRLGEVISNPRIPYVGSGMEYDDSLAPSEFLENDMQKLTRMGGRYFL